MTPHYRITLSTGLHLDIRKPIRDVLEKAIELAEDGQEFEVWDVNTQKQVTTCVAHKETA